MSVLVTGGAGYIGSHTCVQLLDAGYEVIVADNLYNSSEEALRRVEEITGKKLKFYKVDLCDEAECEKLFIENPSIEYVIHFAAYKAVGESVVKPLEYYRNNLDCTMVLLKYMGKYGVNKLVFSSSATVYGVQEKMPLQEDMPTSATNPYGATKLFIERILTDYCAANPNFSTALLRYFNPIGAHPSGLIGEDPIGIPNNLVPYIAQVAIGNLHHLNVYGNDYPTKDGTCIRDYIHVVDLAGGHVFALDKIAKTSGAFLCNLGTGNGYTVLEVIKAYAKACGKPIPYDIAPRRAGDVPVTYADATRAEKELGWKAQYSIEEMCAHSYNWQSKNPNGYRDVKDIII